MSLTDMKSSARRRMF